MENTKFVLADLLIDGKKWSSAVQLSENASTRPHVCVGQWRYLCVAFVLSLYYLCIIFTLSLYYRYYCFYCCYCYFKCNNCFFFLSFFVIYK